MEYKVIANNIEETLILAENIEALKFENMVICLNGELGTGKTVFTKGFARALGIEDNITSPTYTIIKEYEGELPLFHMDVYRLDGNIEGTGIEEYFTKGGVTIIEWAKTIEKYLPEERLDIFIRSIDENRRAFKLVPHGEKYEAICDGDL